MNILHLAWRNANGNTFRTLTVVICSALVAGFAVAATIVIGGAQKSLNLALDRLGADIIVVSEGSQDLMENAFLMGAPARTWMPRDNVDRIAAVPGVAVVSPQFFLSSLRGALCCSVPEMFLIAYDPQTDFTLKPWLEEHLENGLGLGEAVGGSLVYVPQDPGYIKLYGYEINLKGNIEPTGTGIDRSMFITFETAYEISRNSPTLAEEELKIPDDSVSAAMIKLAPGADPHQVAMQIQKAVPEVAAVESNNLFHSRRLQIQGLLQSVFALLGVAWVLFVALIGLVFSMAVNERRQEIGVMRAVGLTRPLVTQSLLAEGLMMAVPGGITGIAVAILAIFLFRNLIIQLLGMPFLIPSAPALLGLSAGALGLSIISVTLGALLPTVHISLMDPVLAMRK